MLQFRECKITGKHALYMKFLCKARTGKKEGVNVFDRNIDLYMIAALVGLKNNAKGKVDNTKNESGGEETATIQLQQMENNRADLEYIYRTIMLLDNSEVLTEKERIARAFRFDNDDSKFLDNMKIFNSYVLGGIEIIYDYFKDDEGSEKQLQNDILRFVKDYYEE